MNGWQWNKYVLVATECDITQEASLIPTPAEHGQWNGNWNINANLTDFNLALKLPSCCAWLRENGCSIAIPIAIDNAYSVVKSVGINNAKNRSKYFFSVAELSVIGSLVDKYYPLVCAHRRDNF